MSNTVPIVGYGYNYIIYDDIKRVGIIKFNSVIASSINTGEDFTAGYAFSNVLAQARIPLANAKKIGGDWLAYCSNGSLNININGSGTAFQAINDGRLQFARVYDIDNKLVGGWAGKTFSQGDYIDGIIFFSY